MKVGNIIAYAMFFLMLFLPTAYQPVKAVFMAAILGIIIVKTFSEGYVNLNIRVFIWTMVVASCGLFFIAVGLVNGAPGALKVATVYVLWPLVYTVFTAGASREEVIKGLFKVLVYATLAVSLYSISYVLNSYGWLPDYLYVKLDQGQRAVFDGRTIEYNVHNISTLLFTVPFLISALTIWPNDFEIPVRRFWLWAALSTGVVSILLSGRRALLFSVMVSPFLIFLFRVFLSGKFRMESRRLLRRSIVGFTVTVVCLCRYLSIVFGLDVKMLSEKFIQGFRFSSDNSAWARRGQFFALIRGWLDSPLVGMGHGASAEGSLRSVEQPWSYELSYVALLFHTGLIGFIIYASWVAWIFWMGTRVLRSGGRLCLYMLPVLTGTSSFLMANFTNPYLSKFDYIWVIFLPLTLVNLWLLNNRNGKTVDSSGINTDKPG